MINKLIILGQLKLWKYTDRVVILLLEFYHTQLNNNLLVSLSLLFNTIQAVIFYY